MRILARNMAWLLKCIDVAKESVPYPVLEKRTKMSFMSMTSIVNNRTMQCIESSAMLGYSYNRKDSSE